MLSAFLLALREGLEAALIVGIVLSALHKMRRSELGASVWLGVGVGGMVSLVSGVGLVLLGIRLEGAAEKAFEGLTMLAAALVLTWVIFWMNRAARQLKAQLEGEVRQAVVTSRRGALFSLAFLAVLREGIELALFLAAAALTAGGQQTVFGASLGLATAVLLGWMLYRGTLRLDLRRFFAITSVLLILFAAGLVAMLFTNSTSWVGFRR